jgi:putative endonuclease
LAKTSKQNLGNWGEKLAEDFLINNGHTILERNWRFGRAEVDLISQDGKTLVFVEVKVRKNSNFGNPEDFVNSSKADRIKIASVEYQILKNYNGFIRFDIVAILGSKLKFELLHLEDSY